MAINTLFHLLKPSPFFKPSANLSKFPRASHFFTISTSDNTNLRLNHGGGRKFSNIPPLECNSEVSSLYSLQILFKSPRASHFSTISTNNYTNLRLNRGGGGSKFSTILPLRSNSERSSSITESRQPIVGNPVAFRNESRTQFHATDFLAWTYKSLLPPSPRVRGPIQGSWIKLRDGRHLSYKEDGVPKEIANYSIIFIHGFGACKHDDSMGLSEMIEKLGIHLVHFDRPGYGESDPDPKRTVKSLVLDIEELADQLELGSKFYVIGASMGGQPVWGCLKYIPHRLAGAALIAPVVNYWWPSFPSNLATEAYSKELVQDQWALRVAHYTPWLVHWWNTQKWFPPHSIIAGKANFTEPDIQLLKKLSQGPVNWEYATQQGVHETLHRDMIVGFGQWEFDPMDLDDPFPTGEGRVHLWQGAEDGLVSASMQRYIAKKLPWIQYHEVANAGHMFLAETAVKDAVLSVLVTGNT